MISTETVDRSGDTGRVVGAFAGVLTGAEAGTALIPIPLVGTVLGAVVGAVVLGEFGRWVGKATMNLAGTVVNAGAMMVRPMAAKVSNTIESSKPEEQVTT